MADYPTPLELAEAGYRGYAAHTGGLTFDGRQMPTWDDLPVRTVGAWVAAVVAVQAGMADSTVQLAEHVPGEHRIPAVESITVTTPEGVVTQVYNATAGTGRAERA